MNEISRSSIQCKPMIEGEMFIVQPSHHTLMVISLIQQVVSGVLRYEGITTWNPVPLDKAHFTLFAGITGLNKRERFSLMKRVAKEMSQLSPFELQITIELFGN